MHRYRILLQAFTTIFPTLTWAQIDFTLKVPPGSPPQGCLNSMTGTFDLNSVQGNTTWSPYSNVTLIGGVMQAQLSRTIIFNTDYVLVRSPEPDVESLYTGGWSICPNGIVTLGPQVEFWECPAPAWSICEQKINESCNPAQLQVNNIGELFSASLTVIGSNQTPTQASTASISTSQAATVFATTSAASNPETLPAVSARLAIGAEAGIGVGAAITASIAVGFSLLLLRRRRMKTDENKEKERDILPQDMTINTSIVSADQQGGKAELMSTRIHELNQETRGMKQHALVGGGPVELASHQQGQNVWVYR